MKVQLTIAFWQAGGTSVADQIVGKQAHNKPTFRRVVAVESEAKLFFFNLVFPLGNIVNSTFLSPSFFILSFRKSSYGFRAVGTQTVRVGGAVTSPGDK